MSSYRPITEKDQKMYPNRILIEHSCGYCGCGFSSIKPTPKFCSHKCYLDHAKPDMAEKARLLWKDEKFRDKIVAARKKAGYPDTNRPEAIARRKMRTAIKNAVRKCLGLYGKNKNASTRELVGYNPNELRLRMESLFLDGMSWNNYGEWEVDHIKPITSFPIGTMLSVVNALSNLQPLWKMDNRRKGCKE